MPAPRRPGKPDVIEELAVHARTRKVIQGVGVGKYYNSAELLLRQVCNCCVILLLCCAVQCVRCWRCTIWLW